MIDVNTSPRTPFQLTVLLEVADLVVLVRRVNVLQAAAERVVREVDHYVVDHVGLVPQAERLHVQDQHQHEAHGACRNEDEIRITIRVN